MIAVQLAVPQRPGERPLGVLSNAVLTPEYSCTDTPLTEDSEPLIMYVTLSTAVTTQLHARNYHRLSLTLSHTHTAMCNKVLIYFAHYG